MIDENLIPGSYQEWRNCITVRCGITLSPTYINDRLAALRDKSDPHTKAFLRLYGESYLNRVIGWFEQAKRESQ